MRGPGRIGMPARGVVAPTADRRISKMKIENAYTATNGDELAGARDEAAARSAALGAGPSVGDSHHAGDSAAGEKRWRRVLIFRSCRMPQFRAAVDFVRSQHPDAEIWALTQEEFRGQVIEAGVDHVLAYRARRIGACRLGPLVLWKLRRLDPDAVVIPLMDAELGPAANLLRLAAVLSPPLVAICAGSMPTHTIGRRALRRLAVRATVRCPESIATLLQMVQALCRRRAKPCVRPPGAPVRVLHIINSLGLGGAQTQFAELINRTPPEQFAVEVLVLDTTGDFSKCRLRRDDVPFSYVGGAGFGDTLVSAVTSHCARGRYDIVHTWLPVANMIGSAAARLADVPYVITSVRSLNPSYCPHYSRWWYRIGDVLAARLADVVTVNATPLVSDHARWALMSRRRIAVVQNGLDADSSDEDRRESRAWLRTLLGREADTIVIGSVARLAIEKDLPTFVRALAAMRRERLEFVAAIVGDGPCDTQLRALVGELGLSGCVAFLGARPDARRIMSGLDLLALTSVVEGFPNVLLEAGLLGVPVVSSDVGGVSDVVTDPQALFPPGDANAAAAAMAAALRDRDRTARQTARQQARCFKFFSADRMVARWLSLYREGVSGKPLAVPRGRDGSTRALEIRRRVQAWRLS